MIRNRRILAAAALLSLASATPAMAASAPTPAPAPAPAARNFLSVRLTGEVPTAELEELIPPADQTRFDALRAALPPADDGLDRVRMTTLINAPALGKKGLALVTLDQLGLQFTLPVKVTEIAPALVPANAAPEGLPFGVDFNVLRSLPARFFRIDVLNVPGVRFLLLGAPLTPEAAGGSAGQATVPAAYRITLFDLGDAGAAVVGSLNK